MDQIKIGLESLTIQPDIFAITESKLNSQYNDDELGFNGYNIFRADRTSLTSSKKTGGGAMLCIKNCFCSYLCDINDISVEHVFVRIPSIKLVIGVVYIPPTSSFNQYSKHSTVVKSLVDIYSDHHIMLVGDYNIPGVIWPVSSPLTCTYTSKAGKDEKINSDHLRDTFSYSNLLQYFPVHFNKGYSLDLLFCNNSVQVEENCDSLLSVDKHHVSYNIFINLDLRYQKFYNTKKKFYRKIFMMQLI